jgi:integron integrase
VSFYQKGSRAIASSRAPREGAKERTVNVVGQGAESTGGVVGTWGQDWWAALRELIRVMRVQHLSLRTERVYGQWITRLMRFVGGVSPHRLGAEHAVRFLSHLAVVRDVAASTQNQAFSALLFFYRHVLRREIGSLGATVRAPRSPRIPAVPTRGQIEDVIERLEGTDRMIVMLIYGCGLRLEECLTLRVKDVDRERRAVVVRCGKGGKDRVVRLPDAVARRWDAHLEEVRSVFARDREQGAEGVALPHALAVKNPAAGHEWGWFWVFPATMASMDPRSGIVRRHHVHASGIQRRFRRVAERVGMTSRVTIHSLRHAFATHLLEDGCDVRVLQELLGHSSLETTKRYTHVAASRCMGVSSPLDRLGRAINGGAA